MDSKLTKFLNIFGFFKTEFCGIEPNRLDEKEIKSILEDNSMIMNIKYFFYPPYLSGNNLFIIKSLKFISKIINYFIKYRVVAMIFGNVAIITGITKRVKK